MSDEEFIDNVKNICELIESVDESQWKDINYVNKMYTFIVDKYGNLARTYPIVIQVIIQQRLFNLNAFKRYIKLIKTNQMSKYQEEYFNKLWPEKRKELLTKIIDEFILQYKNDKDLIDEIKAYRGLFKNLSDENFPPNFKPELNKERDLFKDDCILVTKAHFDALYIYYIHEENSKLSGTKISKSKKQKIIKDIEQKIYNSISQSEFGDDLKLEKWKEYQNKLLECSKEELIADLALVKYTKDDLVKTLNDISFVDNSNIRESTDEGVDLTNTLNMMF